jgi:tetratricopeptide (TPR) repeat protein
MIKKHVWFLLVLVELLMQACSGGQGNVSETKSDTTVTNTSLETLNQKIGADPNNPDLLHERAKYYLAQKDYPKCYDDMMKVLVQDSSKAAYYMTLSDLYFFTNKTRGSKRALEKAIELDDKNIDALLKLAELHLYVKQNKESIEYINQALRIDQYNAKAYFMKGMNYKDLKDTAKAVSSMQTAIEQDKKYFHAYMQLGLIFAAKKNPLAEQYYKNAIQVVPNSSEAWYALGKFYQDMEQWEDAINTYNALAIADAKNKSARYNLGAIYLLNLKKYPLALEQFSQAIYADSTYVEAYYGRGVVYKTMGDNKQAKANFEHCLRLNPDYEPAQTELKQLNKFK